MNIWTVVLSSWILVIPAVVLLSIGMAVTKSPWLRKQLEFVKSGCSTFTTSVYILFCLLGWAHLGVSGACVLLHVTGLMETRYIANLVFSSAAFSALFSGIAKLMEKAVLKMEHSIVSYKYMLYCIVQALSDVASEEELQELIPCVAAWLCVAGDDVPVAFIEKIKQDGTLSPVMAGREAIRMLLAAVTVPSMQDGAKLPNGETVALLKEIISADVSE